MHVIHISSACERSGGVKDVLMCVFLQQLLIYVICINPHKLAPASARGSLQLVCTRCLSVCVCAQADYCCGETVWLLIV